MFKCSFLFVLSLFWGAAGVLYLQLPCQTWDQLHHTAQEPLTFKADFELQLLLVGASPALQVALGLILGSQP